MAGSVAGLMSELGPACSSDEAAFRAVLRQCPVPDEQAAAEVLGVLARGSDSNGSDAGNWSVAVVVDALKAAKPDLAWGRVADLLDFDGFVVPGEKSFVTLAEAFRRGSGGPLPPRAIVGRPWRNVGGQLTLIRQAVSAPPDVFSFESLERKLQPVEGLAGGRSATGTPNQAWLSLDLLEVLCHHSNLEAGHLMVRQILDQPVKSCSEVSPQCSWQPRAAAASEGSGSWS